MDDALSLFSQWMVTTRTEIMDEVNAKPSAVIRVEVIHVEVIHVEVIHVEVIHIEVIHIEVIHAGKRENTKKLGESKKS